MVKLLAAIYEVFDARRRAADFRVFSYCGRDGGIVGVGQPPNALARHGLGKNNEAAVIQFVDGVRWKLAGFRDGPEPVVHRYFVLLAAQLRWITTLCWDYRVT